MGYFHRPTDRHEPTAYGMARHRTARPVRLTLRMRRSIMVSMPKPEPLPERLRDALRPFVRFAEKLEAQGYLRSDATFPAPAPFTAAQWLALLYAAEALV
jgi:hypothetical protein